MPKYAIDPAKYDGSIPFPFLPCDGRAADGNLVEPGFYVDTDAGIVIHHKKDENGQYVTWDFGKYGGLMEVVAVYPAPIVIIPLELPKPDHEVQG